MEGSLKKLYGWYPLGEAWIPIKVDTDGKVVINPTDSGLIAYADTRSKVINSTRDMTAASGDVSYTGVGFTPTSIIATATVSANFAFSVGFADSAKGSLAIRPSSANVMDAGAPLISLYGSDTGKFQAAIVKSYDADGFTLTWTKLGTPGAATASIFFLCFR